MWGNRFYCNRWFMCFFGGVLSATVGLKLLKSETSRNLCVKGIAKGMRLQQDAKEAFQNIKEEAADMCCDAKEHDGAEQ